MSCACPASSWIFAVSASFRCRVGARRIQSRSGRTPISSEFACISTNFVSRARYSSGIQSPTSTSPPSWTWARNVSVRSSMPRCYRTIGRIARMATRRDELVAVATRLFAERGYHGTSMADLAEAMGVQKGSLYSLTESKQELLVAVTRDGAATFHAALDGVPEDEAPLERIRLALRAHLAVVAA